MEDWSADKCCRQARHVLHLSSAEISPVSLKRKQKKTRAQFPTANANWRVKASTFLRPLEVQDGPMHALQGSRLAGAGRCWFSVSGRKRPRATIPHKNSHLLSISPERVTPTPDMALLMSSFKAADMVAGGFGLEE